MNDVFSRFEQTYIKFLLNTLYSFCQQQKLR
jgi:hypothetical protein